MISSFVAAAERGECICLDKAIEIGNKLIGAARSCFPDGSLSIKDYDAALGEKAESGSIESGERERAGRAKPTDDDALVSQFQSSFEDGKLFQRSHHQYG